MNPRRLFLAAALALSFLPAAHAANGEFPRHSVRILVPFSAGLGPDSVLRTVAEHLSREWRQSVVIENRPGASGLLALAEAKLSEPDGHTLVLAEAGAMSVAPYITASSPVDPRKDFTPLTTVFRAKFVIVTGATSPYATLADVINRARAEPGRVSYSSFGNGHASQLAVEDFAAREGITLMHVPYRDGGQLMGDLIHGEVGFTAISAHSVGGMLKEGRLRALAVGTRTRLKELPGVATIAEAGGPDMEMSPWAALFAPAGTPAPLLEKIGRDVRAALASPEVRARIEGMGFEVLGSSSRELGDLVAAETRKNAALIKSGRIRAD